MHKVNVYSYFLLHGIIFSLNVVQVLDLDHIFKCTHFQRVLFPPDMVIFSNFHAIVKSRSWSRVNTHCILFRIHFISFQCLTFFFYSICHGLLSSQNSKCVVPENIHTPPPRMVLPIRPPTKGHLFLIFVLLQIKIIHVSMSRTIDRVFYNPVENSSHGHPRYPSEIFTL